MDPLTHLLTGAAVADALSASGRLGRYATGFAMALAAAPDLDVVPALVAAFPSNPFTDALFDHQVMREVHRGYTHALPVLAVAGVGLGLVAWRWLDKRGGVFGWICLALAALVSHSLLDMANGAVRLWLPFSQEWVGWGQHPEGDPLLLGVLLLCFLSNHPLRFANSRGWGTLVLVEKVSGWFHNRIGSRLRPKVLGVVCLAAVVAIVVLRR